LGQVDKEGFHECVRFGLADLLLGLSALSGEQVFRPGLFLLLVPFLGHFIPGLISGFKDAFEFVGACLCSRVRVINEFLAEVGLLLK
jgi:hypothetical protein